MHTHQVDVCILFSLELFATHVARPVHVKLHVGIKLERENSLFTLVIEIEDKYLVLFSKCLVTALLSTFIVSTVLACQMSSESSERKHDGYVTHVARVFGGLLLLFFILLFCLHIPFLFWVRLFMMCLIVMSKVLFIFEHFVAVFTLEGVIILKTKVTYVQLHISITLPYASVHAFPDEI